MITHRKLVLFCTMINTALVAMFAFVFGVFPFGFVALNLADPALRGPGIPGAAHFVHQRLSPRYEAWAQQRIDSGRARELTTDQLIETEWPVFGSAFYLWATDAMRDAAATPDYAHGAIEAATALLADPGHAKWVREHWGEDYLQHENVFYRMLLLSGLDAHRNLTNSDSNNALIAEQSAALAQDILDAPAGLLEDYPGECYPGDVLAGIAAVMRTGAELPGGREHFRLASRRGFEGAKLDPDFSLPPYSAMRRNGAPIDVARGCGNAYVTFLAPELWPDTAKDWYGQFETHFWQERFGAVGFREYPHGTAESDWSQGDMDAGPIIGGYGMAASAFGLASARSNGRYDHAYPLAAQMLAASWPLPDGTLLLPRLLSNHDAPYLGEAAILFNLTRQPVDGVPIRQGGRIPPLVFAILAAYAGCSLLLALGAASRVRQVLRTKAGTLRWAKFQVGAWALLVVCGVGLLIVQQPGAGMVFLALAQFLPRVKTPTLPQPTALP